MFDTLASWAQEFIAIFVRGGEVFLSLTIGTWTAVEDETAALGFTVQHQGGILPTLIVLLTAVNALIAWIGPDRVNRVGEWAGRDGFAYTPIRYLVWPFLSVFFLTNPMAYTNGQFLPEKYKPAFYDSAVSMVHPPLGIFPHINPGELFVWLGIASGITTLGLELGQLAVRYLITGFIVIYIRGLVTERMTAIMWARQAKAATAEGLYVDPPDQSRHRLTTEEGPES